MSPHSAPVRRPPRGGFTIIELLIVISLIALLMTISLQVIGAFLTAARDSATQTTIRKVQGLLNSRAEALHRLEQSDSFIQNSTEWTVASFVSPTPSNAVQKILTKKLLLRKYFPQHKREITDDDTLGTKFTPPLPKAHPNLTGTGAPANVSNPEILYDVLTGSDSLGEFLTGTDTFSASEVRDTDGNGLPEFVDGWGRPLRFYRWPVRLFRPSGSPTSSNLTNGINLTSAKILLTTLPFFSGNQAADVARDPDDPLRRLLGIVDDTTQIVIPGGAAGKGLGPMTITAPLFTTPVTYHVMLVVSAGPDGIFGMGDPTTSAGYLGDVVNVDALADDISYLSLRAGGK